MSGPSAVILINRELTMADQSVIDEMIDKISLARDGNYFVINNTIPIGGQSITHLPFDYSVYTVNAEESYSSTEIIQIQDFCNFIPITVIRFEAVAKGQDDSLILGEIVLFVATRLQGIIDFGGALLPRKAWALELESKSWSDIKHYYEEMIKEINGKVACIAYETSSDSKWVYNICDTIFMQNWLTHPEFHMIK